jgi:hypothetical protein
MFVSDLTEDDGSFHEEEGELPHLDENGGEVQAESRRTERFNRRQSQARARTEQTHETLRGNGMQDIEMLNADKFVLSYDCDMVTCMSKSLPELVGSFIDWKQVPGNPPCPYYPKSSLPGQEGRHYAPRSDGIGPRIEVFTTPSRMSNTFRSRFRCHVKEGCSASLGSVPNFQIMKIHAANHTWNVHMLFLDATPSDRRPPHATDREVQAFTEVLNEAVRDAKVNDPIEFAIKDEFMKWEDAVAWTGDIAAAKKMHPFRTEGLTAMATLAIAFEVAEVLERKVQECARRGMDSPCFRRLLYQSYFVATLAGNKNTSGRRVLPCTVQFGEDGSEGCFEAEGSDDGRSGDGNSIEGSIDFGDSNHHVNGDVLAAFLRAAMPTRCGYAPSIPDSVDNDIPPPEGLGLKCHVYADRGTHINFKCPEAANKSVLTTMDTSDFLRRYMRDHGSDDSGYVSDGGHAIEMEATGANADLDVVGALRAVASKSRINMSRYPVFGMTQIVNSHSGSVRLALIGDAQKKTLAHPKRGHVVGVKAYANTSKVGTKQSLRLDGPFPYKARRRATWTELLRILEVCC